MTPRRRKIARAACSFLHMDKASRILLAAAMLASICIHAQVQTSTTLKFEVASVKPSDPNARGVKFTRIPGNGLTGTNVGLQQLITFAYDVPDFRISGAPGWISNTRYNIEAKPEHPEGPADFKTATPEQDQQLWESLRERTRSLLAERFQLAVHKESKEFPA